MPTAVEMVRQFRRLRVLLLGDAMLDTYVEGTATRLCSEGPVPVVHKIAEAHAPGGAANTAANLSALGAEVLFPGFIGRDPAGSLLRAALRDHRIDDGWLIEDEQAATPHKLRVLAEGQYVVRLDDGAAGCYTTRSQDGLLAKLERAFRLCDLVVVSDYNYGAVFAAAIERLRTLRARHPRVMVVDSKNVLRFHSAGATVITPNHLEAQRAVEPGTNVAVPGGDLERMERIGRRLLESIDAAHAAITLAADGVLLLDRQGASLHLPAHPVATPNVAGAGDSFAAALALALGAGAGVEEAARLGLDAAGIAVTRQRTAVVQHQELLQRVSLRDHATVATAELDLRRATTYLAAQLFEERLAGRTIVFTNGVFDILHAGHMHLLRQAKELGDVLVVGVNSDQSARRLKGANRPVTNEHDRLALVAALECVDHAILFDEETPAALIRALRPHLHVKGGDYAGERLPEAEAVEEAGGRVVIVPLVGNVSTSSVIERIVALASSGATSAGAAR